MAALPTGCRDAIDTEVRRIVNLGILFEQVHRVTDLRAEMREGHFGAVSLR